MRLDFRSHRLADGLFADRRHVDVDGPVAPGTLVVWCPETDGIAPKAGVIVGVVGDTVHVMWNSWQQDPSALGARTRLGPPPVKSRRRKG